MSMIILFEVGISSTVVLILKALKETSDREIYEQLIRGDHNNTFLSDRLELLLRESKNMHL